MLKLDYEKWKAVAPTLRLTGHGLFWRVRTGLTTFELRPALPHDLVELRRAGVILPDEEKVRKSLTAGRPVDCGAGS